MTTVATCSNAQGIWLMCGWPFAARSFLQPGWPFSEDVLRYMVQQR